MSYTALKKMQQQNKKLFGTDIGPFPPKYILDKNDRGLKSMSLRFLHERCEGLGFNASSCIDEDYSGTSSAPGQIPHDMQMDINRLCLVRELETFIESGTAEDAYTVYYCFLEMFFGHYGPSKKMVELLSEYEVNGSSLLMKHRDHYSHSVYVFSLGLAIYESNKSFRNSFKTFYGFNPDSDDMEADHAAACCFLKFWGLAALFHDIGYPFEIPFEQVISYHEINGISRDKGNLYLAYHDVGSIIDLNDEDAGHFERLCSRRFKTMEEIFAFDLAEKFGKEYGFSEEYILDQIHSKPIAPNTCNYFMDHAYFSATILFKEMLNVLGASEMDRRHIDALTAILLHNSLFKFSILLGKTKNGKIPLRMDVHPLAYMLMLCDELQCWDRTTYGRNSRKELHPMSAQFEFGNDRIKVVYGFDKNDEDKIGDFRIKHIEWERNDRNGSEPRLKTYSDMTGEKNRFAGNIEKIIDASPVGITVTTGLVEPDFGKKHMYLSSSSFLHLYDFAVALNARYIHEDDSTTDWLEQRFKDLSLEYQLSNINQAKSFSRYLNRIGCFYTDRPVAYEMVKAFTPEQTAVFAPLEHARWVREQIAMGWTYGTFYEDVKLPAEVLAHFKDEKTARKALRERMRVHKYAMDGNPDDKKIFEHYHALPEEEQDKDIKPFNTLLEKLRLFDGVRIYKLPV